MFAILFRLFVAIAALLAAAGYVEALTAGGANVCSYSVRRTQPYTASVAYTAYENYRTCCSHFMWCWSHCTKSRAVTRYRHETRYRTYYQLQYRCCSGWIQGFGSSECRTPVCNSPACVHGTCVRPNTCSCHSGYTNPSTGCVTDINECSTGNGQCEQQCNNHMGGYSCSCRRGFTLYNARYCRDNNECSVSHGICSCDDPPNNPSCIATCINTIGSFRCSCSAGYQIVASTRCVDRNECMLNHGGCDHLCINLPGSHRCACRVGFALDHNGTTCNDINECTVNNGGCEHTCVNKFGSFECRCAAGHFLDPNGKTCSDVDECSLNAHGCQHICNNYKGGFYCSCRNGYKLNNDNKTCSDVDECTTLKAGPGGINVTLAGCTQLCHNNIGSFSCSCRNGYNLMQDGKTCTDINECSGNHGCQHICLNTLGSYICKCQNGYRLISDRKSCIGLPCIRLPPIINGNGTCFIGKTNDTCQLRCFVGFELRGSSLRQCLSNHKWSGSLTTCSRKYCDTLEPPSNGAVVLPCMNYYQASCTVKCNSGYYAIGATKRTCRATADNRMHWSNAGVICKEITVCSPNPCMHNGTCVEVSKTEYRCNCQNTGYEGPTCNQGIVTIPRYPVIYLNRFYNFFVTAKPDEELILRITSNNIGIAFRPPSFVFTKSLNTFPFQLKASKSGMFVIYYSLSGKDAESFKVPPISIIYVREEGFNNHVVINNVINDNGNLLPGCHNSNKLSVGKAENKAITMRSNAPWNDTNGRVSTDGIVVMDYEGNIMPTSIVGGIVTAESIQNNDFGLYINKYSVDDVNTTKSPTTDETKKCSSKDPSTKYLSEVVEVNAFSKTIADSVNKRTPYWINLAANLTTQDFTVTDFIANVYNDTKVRQLYPECAKLLDHRSNNNHWYTYVTRQRMLLHVTEDELELDDGKETCIFESLDRNDTLVAFSQSEKYSKALDTTTGWSGKIKSIEYQNNSHNSSWKSFGAFSSGLSFNDSQIIVNVTGSLQLFISDSNKLASEGIRTFKQASASGLISIAMKSSSDNDFVLKGKGVLNSRIKDVSRDECAQSNFVIDISLTEKTKIGPKLGKIVQIDDTSASVLKLSVLDSGGKVMDVQNLSHFTNIDTQIKMLNRTLSRILVANFSNHNVSSIIGDVENALRLSGELVTLCTINAGPRILPLFIELKKTVFRVERKFQVLSIGLSGRLDQSLQTLINETYGKLRFQLKREPVSKKVRSYSVTASGTMCLDNLCFANTKFEIIRGSLNLQLKKCYGINGQESRIEYETLVIGITTIERNLGGVLKIPSNTRVLYFTSKTGPGTGMFNASLSIYGSQMQVEVTVYNNTLSFTANVTLPDTSIAEMRFSAGLSNLKLDGDVLMKVRGLFDSESNLISKMNAFLQKKLARMSNQTKARIGTLKRALELTSKQLVEASRNLRELAQDYAALLTNERQVNESLNAVRASYEHYKSILQTKLKKHDSLITNYTKAIENCAPRICVSKCVPGVVKAMCFDDRFIVINVKSCNLVTKSHVTTELQQVSSPDSYITLDAKSNCKTKCPPLTGFFKSIFGRKRRGLVGVLVSKVLVPLAKKAGPSIFEYLGGETGKMGAKIGAMLPGPWGVVGMIVGGVIGSMFGSCDRTCQTYMVPRLVEFTRYDVEKVARTVFYKESQCKNTVKEVKSGYQHARECLQQRNCSEYMTDVKCVHKNHECLAMRRYLRRRIDQEAGMGPTYDEFVKQSLRLESLEMTKRFVEAEKKNAYQSYQFAKSLLTNANYSMDIAKQALASTSAILQLEIKASKGVDMHGVNAYSVVNGRCVFYTSRGSVIPMSLALDMDVVGGDAKKSVTTSIIHLKNTNESVVDAVNDVIKTFFVKSARKRRSTSNADDVTETITIGDLDLNVTKIKCNTTETRLFYLAKVLNGFVKGIHHYENMTKELEIAEQRRRNFTQNIKTSIQASAVCSNNSMNQSIKADNCSTEWLASMYENAINGTKTNVTLSWSTARTQMITELEMFTKLQNFTTCAGVRDCVNTSIDAISELIEFEQSYLARLCREAIPVWRESYQRMLNNDSITMNDMKEQTDIVTKSFATTRPIDIYCDSEPIIIKDLPGEVIVAKDQFAVLNFSLVSTTHQATFKWRKNGDTMSNSVQQSLVLTSIDSSVAGYYNCEIANKFGKVTTQTVHVVYQEKPRIITHPKDVKTTLKSPASLITLTCNASAVPMPKISWLYAPFSNISQRTLLPYNQSVVYVNSTSSNQSGFYYCKASNPQGFVYSRPARVHVLGSRIAEISMKLSFYVSSQPGQENETTTPVPTALSSENLANVTVILAGHINISTNRISNMHYSKVSNESAILSFDLRTQDLNRMLVATSDWTTMSEDIVMARKGLLIISMWLHHVFRNVSNSLLIANANLSVNTDTLDVDALPSKCLPGYSLNSNGFMCEICPAGSKYVPGIGCNLCPVSSYQWQQGQNNCLKCPEKFLTQSVGSVHLGDCFKPVPTTTPPPTTTGPPTTTPPATTTTASEPTTFSFSANPRTTDGTEAPSTDLTSTPPSVIGPVGPTFDEKRNMKVIIGASVGSFVFLVVVIAIGFMFCKRRRKPKTAETGAQGTPRVFKVHEGSFYPAYEYPNRRLVEREESPVALSFDNSAYESHELKDINNMRP